MNYGSMDTIGCRTMVITTNVMNGSPTVSHFMTRPLRNISRRMMFFYTHTHTHTNVYSLGVLDFFSIFNFVISNL